MVTDVSRVPLTLLAPARGSAAFPPSSGLGKPSRRARATAHVADVLNVESLVIRFPVRTVISRGFLKYGLGWNIPPSLPLQLLQQPPSSSARRRRPVMQSCPHTLGLVHSGRRMGDRGQPLTSARPGVAQKSCHATRCSFKRDVGIRHLRRL